VGRPEEELTRDGGEQAYRRFQETHRSLADRVERVLMQAVILGLVTLTLVQTLQVVPFIRRQLSITEALEGITYEEFLAWLPDREGAEPPDLAAAPASRLAAPFTLTVVLVNKPSAPGARLLVDGQVVGTFEEAALTVAVSPGQQVEVDGTQVPEELIFRVVGAAGLESPALGSSVVTRGGRQSLGEVQPAAGAS